MGPQTVRATGFVATAFASDSASVDHLNRTLRAIGHDSAQLGTRRLNDNPYMWQGLRIGPLMPTIPASFKAELFGLTWISHRVREVAGEGFDAFLCEYDYQAFDKRMRVRRVGDGVIPRQLVHPSGFAAARVGTPNARPGVHYIRPDGNSDQSRKGVPA